MAYYGERSGFGGLNMFPPVIKWLLGLNIGLFLLGFLPGGSIEGEAVSMRIQLLVWGGLWPIGHEFFMPWQYVTYMFLHGGFGHVFLNMLMLWMFGMELEQMWGSRRFLAFYMICGIGAGLIHSLVTLAMGTGAPTVGASGAIMGIMVAFAMIAPDRMIYVMLFLPMKAKYAVLLYAAIDLYSGVMQTGSNVAHFAHLGGALFGYIMLKIGGPMTLGGIFDRFGRRNPAPAPRVQPRPINVPGGRVIDAEFREVARRQNPPEMNFGDAQERVDEILDKISRSGYQNLTEEEKRILLDASRKMR